MIHNQSLLSSQFIGHQSTANSAKWPRLPVVTTSNIISHLNVLDMPCLRSKTSRTCRLSGSQILQQANAISITSFTLVFEDITRSNHTDQKGHILYFMWTNYSGCSLNELCRAELQGHVRHSLGPRTCMSQTIVPFRQSRAPRTMYDICGRIVSPFTDQQK